MGMATLASSVEAFLPSPSGFHSLSPPSSSAAGGLSSLVSLQLPYSPRHLGPSSSRRRILHVVVSTAAIESVAGTNVAAVRFGTRGRTLGNFSGTQLRHHLHVQKLPSRVWCLQKDGSFSQTSSTMSMEPKWKQKLAAADDHAERTRQKTLLVQEEYKQKQAAMQRLQADTSKDVVPLRDLEFLPYLKEDGLITDCTKPNAKASVYAIFDNDKVLQYIGISRQVYSSMRLHFARMPLKCYYVKITNISKPSRSLLELIRDKWIEENGTRPRGNDSGPEQNVWENPLDCKPLMTDEETDKFEQAGAGPPKAKVLKNVARRVEAQLEKSYASRNCKERLRFDPKLKEKGLLDLKNI